MYVIKAVSEQRMGQGLGTVRILLISQQGAGYICNDVDTHGCICSLKTHNYHYRLWAPGIESLNAIASVFLETVMLGASFRLCQQSGNKLDRKVSRVSFARTACSRSFSTRCTHCLTCQLITWSGFMRSKYWHVLRTIWMRRLDTTNGRRWRQIWRSLRSTTPEPG